jgi:hypothetical protein
MDNQVLAYFLVGIFPTDQRDLSIFSPSRKALPSFVSQVVFRLRPDTTVTGLSSAIWDLSPPRVIGCTDANLNLSLVLSFPDSAAGLLGLR